MNDKESVRQKLKIKRRYFQNYQRQAADCAISDNFLNEFGTYESFFIYNSFSTEADTKAIISRLLQAGKRVYLPRIDGDKMVAVPYGQTVRGGFGIDEPVGQAYEGDIQITVIPLLAVNERGFRIGYGKGYYDGYLKDKNTKKVGLGYHFQLEQFKEDEWDVPLDLFICEKGKYEYAIHG